MTLLINAVVSFELTKWTAALLYLEKGDWVMNSYSITRDKFMSVKEARKLLRVCRRNAVVDMKANRTTWVTRYMVIHLALHSGLRVSEIASLKASDLHFNGKDNYLIVQCGKRGRKRDVYLDQELVKHLQDYLGIRKNTWNERLDSDSPLFAGRGGAHYTTTALEISFKKAIEKAGLSMHYSIHSARHSYATFLFAKSNSIRFVQKQLGHASIAMTSLYADVLPEMNQALAETILK
jgi:site-specific recombinase XerD